MRNSCLILLTLLAMGLNAQNKHTVFYDSLGRVTTWEEHWAQVIAGGYKSVYHKAENKKTLIKTTPEAFEAEVLKTEKRISTTLHIGTDFPDFEVYDINGNKLSKTELLGKVVVINFWFVGCAPCEMERPALNALADLYAENEQVVFLSFARNNREELTKFLPSHPLQYAVVPTEKDFIPNTFGVSAYPTNIILGRDGKYFYNSEASGIGIQTILQRQIDRALME